MFFCFYFFLGFFFFLIVFYTQSENRRVIKLYFFVFKLYSLTADIKWIKWCIMMNFTLNKFYSFKLMCLQATYLNIQYQLHFLLKSKCCLCCPAFTDMSEIKFPIIRLSEYYPMFEGKQFVKILYKTLAMGISISLS